MDDQNQQQPVGDQGGAQPGIQTPPAGDTVVPPAEAPVVPPTPEPVQPEPTPAVPQAEEPQAPTPGTDTNQGGDQAV